MLFYPLSTFLAFFLRKTKNSQFKYEIAAIGGIAFVIGDVIWLFFEYVLLWAPLDAILLGKGRVWFQILSAIIICIIVVVIINLIGKKKGWKYQPRM